MNIKIMPFIYLLMFCSCTSVAIKPHIIAADKVTNPFIEEARKKHGLQMLGSGGKMMYQVEDISVSFITCGEYNLTQARKHYLSVVTPFVENIRNSSELKQYLMHPNQPERAALVSITYRTPNKKEPKPPLIAHVFMYDGLLVYSVSDSPDTGYRTIHEETYQEALERANCTH